MSDYKWVATVIGMVVMAGGILITVGDTNKTVKTNEQAVAEFDERIDSIEKKQAGDTRDMEHLKEGVDSNSKKLDRILEKL